MEVEVRKANPDMVKGVKSVKVGMVRVCAYCRVSTDDEEQLNSYRSMVKHYTALIKEKKEWVFAGIYADEAITGTQVGKREEFQRMINDCMMGQIDMVITKSISRFARNTLDTLQYVRKLKEHGVAVFFEEENINTLTMDGELLLVILSSVAQQEVENISANVKNGLKMKMKRGELVGFQGCMGYDYNKEDKTLTINRQGAEIVQYIFERYVQGRGASVIARELNNLGHKTLRNNEWTTSTVIGIIKNEKYKGDILLGKTFTLDPISKRRLENLGEEDQFYIKDHHEPIISKELFAQAHEILSRRNSTRTRALPGKREKYSRQYAFSCLLECGFCGGNLSRRNWHSSTNHSKVIWQCVIATKKGKKYCPDSKGIPEAVIEKAFVESYTLLSGDNREVLEEFIQRVEKTLLSSTIEKKIKKIENELFTLSEKRKKLVDLRLEEKLDKGMYEEKYVELEERYKYLLSEKRTYEEQHTDEERLRSRITEFKKTLEGNEVLQEFDRDIFESIIEKVIVGNVDENGNKDPYKLTFIYKTGLSNQVDSEYKPRNVGKQVKEQLVKATSYCKDKVEKATSYCSDTTC